MAEGRLPAGSMFARASLASVVGWCSVGLCLAAPKPRNAPPIAGPQVNVFGGAIATVDGIRRVLLSVGAAPDALPVNGRQVQAVWHLQREEPVIYVNGR